MPPARWPPSASRRAGGARRELRALLSRSTPPRMRRGEEALNAVHQTAAEIAKSRHDLELRLMEVQGRDADLLAARRADEMAATDEPDCSS
jgi:hypothetical protein